MERREVNGQAVEPGWESRLDIEANDIIIQGSNSTRLSRKQVCIPILFENNHQITYPHSLPKKTFIQNESVSYFSILILYINVTT